MKRRELILASLQNSTVPISGSELAKQFTVSRQIIVQDIAVLRAAGDTIISTNKGYLLRQKTVHKRIIKLVHGEDRIEEELTTIVDLGGKVEDIFFFHKVYGKLRAQLSIKSRHDIQEFLHEYQSDDDNPIKSITLSTHYQTILADSDETLTLIEDTLKAKHLAV
ncbi:MAG: transcription repressor NadR [bacterium]|nr:transcription repressor NadR [bacterium]